MRASSADIADSLTSDRTKRNIARLTALMARDGIDFDAFVAEVNRRRMPVKWYMAWLLSRYVEQNPDHGTRSQRVIWDLLKSCEVDSMRRDLWRALSFVEVEEAIAGEVFDVAMDIIPSSNQPIAVRAHAMFAARNIARPYAELRKELGLVLDGLSPEESPAIRARSRNIVRQLARYERTG